MDDLSIWLSAVIIVGVFVLIVAVVRSMTKSGFSSIDGKDGMIDLGGLKLEKKKR